MRAQRRNTSIFFLACCLPLFALADASDDSSRPRSPHLRRAAEKSPGDGDASSSYLDTKMKLVWHDASRFVPSVKNPSPDKATVSSATVAGKFVQDAKSLKEAMEKYEHESEHPAAAIYRTESIQDASIYVTGQAVFELDVLCAPAEVPEGTEIVLALGDAAGKLQHSRYSAVLAKPGKNFGWQRLRFRLLGRPNPKVPDHEVQTLSFSFPPNVFDKYVWTGWELWLDYLRTVARDPPSWHRYPDPADFQFALPTSSPPTAAPVVRMRDDFDEVHNTVDNWTWRQPYHLWRLVRPLCPVDTDDPCTTQAAYTGVPNADATDGLVATLSYPSGRPDDEIGPKYSTLLLNANDTDLLLYGNWEARLKTPDAGPDEGIVSAFYTYFNNNTDYDDDGLTDNHEVDVELWSCGCAIADLCNSGPRLFGCTFSVLAFGFLSKTSSSSAAAAAALFFSKTSSPSVAAAAAVTAIFFSRLRRRSRAR